MKLTVQRHGLTKTLRLCYRTVGSFPSIHSSPPHYRRPFTQCFRTTIKKKTQRIKKNAPVVSWELYLIWQIKLRTLFSLQNIVYLESWYDLSDWLFHLAICISAFSMYFYDLIAHLFLAFNIIPLSRCTLVYLHIHLLKDILVASSFGQWGIKLM